MPTGGSRVVFVNISDGLTGQRQTTSAVVHIDFNKVNDPPYLDVNGDGEGVDFETDYTEEGPATSIVDGQLTLRDSDNLTLASVPGRRAIHRRSTCRIRSWHGC